jgi:hypothetical protein
LPTSVTRRNAFLGYTPLEDFRQRAECLAVPSGGIDESTKKRNWSDPGIGLVG